MAFSHEWLFQSTTFYVWIFTILLGESQSKRAQIYYMQGATCGNKYNITGAVVYSHSSRSNHEDDNLYPDEIECTVTFATKIEKWKLMIQVTELDIPDKTRRGICNDALYVYNADTVFTRAMSEAGGNGGLCGSRLPSVIYSSGRFLTVHFRTDTQGRRGRGFKYIITAFSEDFRKNNSCGSNFQCDNQLCIDANLVCDKVDNCGDGSDEAAEGRSICGHKGKEENEDIINRFLSLGVTASVAITVGSVVVLIVVVVAVVCCCRRSSCRKSQDSTHNGVTTTATSVLSNGTAAMAYHQTAPMTMGAFQPVYDHQQVQQGYHPMQPVYPVHPTQHTHPMHGSTAGSAVYAPFYQRESYSHHSAYSSQPPSYMRSHTPTSSKSAKSNRSHNSVPYSQGTDKIMLPVHL